MKNIKNSKLKAKDASIEQVKEGKIKKNKQTKKKKSEDELAKVKDISLIQKTEGIINGNYNARKLKNKNSPTKPEENKRAIDDARIIENSREKDLTKKKHKQNVQAEVSSKEHTENELKRTSEKKSKKLKKHKAKTKNNGGIQNIEEPVTVATSESYSAGSKVLMKKQKKAQKRQLTKDQKFSEKQTRDPAIEEATVFVGNVPVNIKRPQIIRLFKDFAPVSSIRLRSAGGKVLYKHKQRKLAGSLNAYVVLKDKETAEKALSLNGTELKGNHLRVTSLKKLPNHEKEDAKRTVFVGNLKYSCTEEILREIFLSCGEIDYIRCIRDGDKGCKGIGYVCFKTADSVGLALELNGTIVDERPINVERFSVKKLGAKEACEALANKTKNNKRLDENKSKNDKSANEKQIHSKTDDVKTTKKSEFRGVKVESMKKKQKSKKKKSNNEMLKLAKKIAFKSAT